MNAKLGCLYSQKNNKTLLFIGQRTNPAGRETALEMLFIYADVCLL
jgi:hypothetical protein